ncbi:MAG: Do family serine endopeptidase [Pseudomonadota bacterium]
MRLLNDTFLVCLLLSVSVAAQTALPASDGNGKPLPSLAPLVDKATPAVVNIATSTTQRSNNPLFNDPFFRHFFNVPQRQYRARKVQSAGSGVILDARDGIVVTNHHVVKNADEIRVILHDGRVMDAELIGSDSEVDIAVLRVTARNLVQIKVADSSRARVGDFVIAIGNPFGLNQTVTTGIISALGRTGLGIEGLEDFIQTDASINPGNSGGALLNLDGELVGINTAIIAPSGGNVGIGFAIPANMALASVSQIVEYGAVSRGRIGVDTQDIDEELAQAFDLPSRAGALIASIEPGSPADLAGLQAGDVIVKVDQQKVRSSRSYQNAIALLRIGEQVDVTVVRNGKNKTARCVIADPFDFVSNQLQSPMGVHLEGARFKEDAKLGLVVVRLEQGSNAWQSGLRMNDVILSANRRKVRTVEHMDYALRLSNSQLLLRVLRGNAALYLVIR